MFGGKELRGLLVSLLLN